MSYEIFNEQESPALSTNPYYFHKMETNELEGSYNSQKDDMFAKDEYCSSSIERDMFRHNVKECYDPIYDGLAEENEEYNPFTFLDFEDNVSIHEEEDASRKDYKITSDLLCNEIIDTSEHPFRYWEGAFFIL